MFKRKKRLIHVYSLHYLSWELSQPCVSFFVYSSSADDAIKQFTARYPPSKDDNGTSIVLVDYGVYNEAAKYGA